MNFTYQLPERRRKSTARLMVLMISTALLWVAAVALIFMACAIPASWVSAVRNPEREPTPATAPSTEADAADVNSDETLATPAANELATTGATAESPANSDPGTSDPNIDSPTGEQFPQDAAVLDTPPPLLQTGTLIDAQLLDSYTVDTINNFSTNFYKNVPSYPARYSVDRYQLRFQTINQHHELTTIRAELYVPRVDFTAEFPIFVYGSGTTGIGNSCAPLDELTRGRNWGSYRVHMLSYAAQGYISILPLWQGYDDPTKTHPYFVAELEGPVMLDATRAVYRFFETNASLQARPAAAIFFGGYSQGGHGAFSADAMAAAYAPELPIKGIIGHATAPNVEALMREAPSLAAYIVYAYRDYYGPDVIDPVSVFQERWLPTFYNDASNKCVDEIYDYYNGGQANLYLPGFSNALYSGQLGFNFPYFKQALDQNDVGRTVNPNTPALLLHGSADPIVTAQTNEQFMRQICAQGKPVTYYLYDNVHHFQTRQHSFVDTLNWMQSILSGIPVRSDCDVVLGQ